MAVLRSKDAVKMNLKERTDKLKDLRIEIIRANVTAHKATSKTKEIKKAIARILTFNSMEELKKK